MKKNNIIPKALQCLIFSFLFLFLPLTAYASQLFHTIQIGSFIKIAPAEEQFDYVVQQLNDEELDHLRIEKVGKFYSVRLGKFNDFSSAEKFYEVIKSRLPHVTVMEAYIKEKRIKRQYAVASTPDMQAENEKPLSNALPETDELQSDDELSKDGIEVTLEDKIAVAANLVGEKDYDSALSIIMEEIAAQPDNPDLHAWSGMVHLKMGRPFEAMEHLTKAVEISPDVSDYHNGLGYSFLFLNKFENAINAFNNAIHLDPVHLDALTGLCITYAKSGRTEKALNVYHKLEALDQEIPDGLLKLLNTSS